MFRNDRHRSIVADIKKELTQSIMEKYSAILMINKKREETASSWKNKVVGIVGTVGTAVGVAGTVAAVAAAGPFSVPAAIAGSRFLATTFVFGGGITGAATALNFGRAIVNRIPGLNRRRIMEE